MSSGNSFKSYIKGVFVSIITALIFVLIFAIVAQKFSLGSSVIKPVNQFLKVISLFIGVAFAVKGDKGLFKGLIFGLTVSILQFILFGFIGGNLHFGLNAVWEVLLGGVVGAIFGIIRVNAKLHTA